MDRATKCTDCGNIYIINVWQYQNRLYGCPKCGSTNQELTEIRRLPFYDQDTNELTYISEGMGHI